MKKSELKQLIRETLEEARLENVMDSLKSDMENSRFHTDFLDNAAKLIQLALVQAHRAEYAMSDLGPAGDFGPDGGFDTDVNDPTITKAAVHDLIKKLEALKSNPLLRNRGR